jgi:hypothetical protein
MLAVTIVSAHAVFIADSYGHLNEGFTDFVEGPATGLELSVEVRNECYATQQPFHQCQMIRERF